MLYRSGKPTCQAEHICQRPGAGCGDLAKADRAGTHNGTLRTGTPRISGNEVHPSTRVHCSEWQTHSEGRKTKVQAGGHWYQVICSRVARNPPVKFLILYPWDKSPCLCFLRKVHIHPTDMKLGTNTILNVGK